jgi:hypothetical protein
MECASVAGIGTLSFESGGVHGDACFDVSNTSNGDIVYDDAKDRNGHASHPGPIGRRE